MRYGLIAFALIIGTPAMAGSGLGIEGAALSFGALQDETGDMQVRFSTSVDVAITAAHGLQGDLSFQDTSGGTIGRLAGHLYMDPVPGQKYGLFLALSDLDGRSLTWGDFGVEGQFALSDVTVIEGRAGLGRADSGSLDYIFGGLSLAHAISPDITLEASLDLAEFDEADFRATAVDAGLRVAYTPEDSHWGLYAEVVHSDLTGRDGTRGGDASRRRGHNDFRACRGRYDRRTPVPRLRRRRRSGPARASLTGRPRSGARCHSPFFRHIFAP